MMGTMTGSGLLRPDATPEQVATTNALLAAVREHWRLACAWERIDPAVAEVHLELHPDNPYADGYHLALMRYCEYRDLHTRGGGTTLRN